MPYTPGAEETDARLDSGLSEDVRLIVARVADELSDPDSLANLLLRIELMLAEADDPRGQATLLHDLRALDRSARRLIDLVETLRCYSGEGPAGWRPLRVVPLSLSRGVYSGKLALVTMPSSAGLVGRRSPRPVVSGREGQLMRAVASGPWG